MATMNARGIVLFVVLMVGILAGITALLWNFGNQEEVVSPEVSGEMRHVRGEGEVVVVEWSDFQCPACAGVQQTVKEVMDQYEGRAKLVYRHLPLTTIHRNAMVGSIAAEAANEQGKFWEMHDMLFQRQGEWAELDDPNEKLVEYARELGMDEEKFRSDMENEGLRQFVLVDSTEAVKYRIQATPTFFVDGERVELSQLSGAIEARLE